MKLALQVTVQPLTEDLRSELQNIPFEDGSRVEGLGDEAYVTKFDQVIAVSGDIALAAKLQNYPGRVEQVPQRLGGRGACRAPAPRSGRRPATFVSPWVKWPRHVHEAKVVAFAPLHTHPIWGSCPSYRVRPSGEDCRDGRSNPPEVLR